jgi:CheY-like chemotaxis protein
MTYDILLVEDDEDIAEIVTEILEQHGYRVARAGDGVEALHRLRSEAELPKVIFLDLLMPVMDGSAFRGEQLLDTRLSQIPIVVMSALADGPARAHELKPAEYLSKPIHAQALVEMARKMCRGA